MLIKLLYLPNCLLSDPDTAKFRRAVELTIQSCRLTNRLTYFKAAISNGGDRSADPTKLPLHVRIMCNRGIAPEMEIYCILAFISTSYSIQILGPSYSYL